MANSPKSSKTARARRPATSFGMTLSSEEHGPARLVDLAARAEDLGFDFVSISDHYHPWVDTQGHSPFVWSVLGAIAARTSTLGVAVGVTCPTVRIHPAVLAQATATTSLLLDGRFVWGVGSGEALNEHILGDRWPPTDIRHEMLEEAIAVVRELWRGEETTHRGPHYIVENARLYDPPDPAPPVIVSAFGPKAAQLSARVGDGLWVGGADTDTIGTWRKAGGHGPVYAQLTLCWAADREEAVATAFRVWPNTAVPGQLSQDLSTPALFEQACENVTAEMIAEAVPCGPDLAPIVERVQSMVDAGIDHVYFHQIGPDQEGFGDFWRDELGDAVRSPQTQATALTTPGLEKLWVSYPSGRGNQRPMREQTRPNSSRRRVAALTGITAMFVLGAAACGDDDDTPDDTEIDVVTSDVTESSMVSVDSEVTIGTTLTSEVEVTEVETDVSEVVVGDSTQDT